MTRRFKDRSEAGRCLAERLAAYAGRDDVVVLALPRGGVPVAFEVAAALRAPLDVFLVRKLGVPWHEELAFGALSSGGVIVLNDRVVELSGLDSFAIDEVVRQAQCELERRERLYREERVVARLAGQVAIAVDDGLATGASMRAAVSALRRHAPARVVVAVPVAPIESCEILREEADEIVCVVTPEMFHSVGAWYDDFNQTSDAQVQDLLRAAPAPAASPTCTPAPPPPGSPRARGA
jgi:putative phosphoribosyl transferase